MNSKEKFLNDLFRSTLGNEDLVFISSIFIELHTALKDEDTTANKLASIIEKDPGLTTAMLRMANSSYYGLSKKVANIRTAISILGYKTIEKIFLTQACSKAFKTSNSKITHKLWHHSLATAIATQLIVSEKRPQLEEVAFTIGLLHDMGKFLLINFRAEEMVMCLDDIKINPFQYSVPLEMNIIGVNHQDIGEYFAKKWLFPDIIVNSIKYHHSLEITENADEMVAAVAIANQIVKALELGTSTSGLIEAIPNRIYSLIDFTQQDFEKFARLTKQKFYEFISNTEEE